MTCRRTWRTWSAPRAHRSPTGGADTRAALRGDLHTHSDWSDGGSPIEEMVMTAMELGHEYLALTDHSPRLRVANGLSVGRLTKQLDVVDAVNAHLGGGFRLLRGIEVDILDDGALDQTEEMLGRLDVVVASVHSKLRMDAGPMTRRMVAAVQHPRTNVLGHCTGRLVTGGRGTRPQSEFDAEAVFTACRDHDVAVEINSRPERQDPPDDLLEDWPSRSAACSRSTATRTRPGSSTSCPSEPSGRERLGVPAGPDRHDLAARRPPRLGEVRLVFRYDERGGHSDPARAGGGTAEPPAPAHRRGLPSRRRPDRRPHPGPPDQGRGAGVGGDDGGPDREAGAPSQAVGRGTGEAGRPSCRRATSRGSPGRTRCAGSTTRSTGGAPAPRPRDRSGCPTGCRGCRPG